MERTCTTPGCSKRHVAKGLCSTCYNRKNYTNEQRHKPRQTTCTICGAPMATLSSKRHRNVCSQYCRWFHQSPVLSCPIPEAHPAHPRWIDRRLPVLWVAQAPADPKPAAVKVWTAGYCAQCKAPFLDRQPSARFCSLACGRRHHRRKAKRTSGVSARVRQYIFRRDGWRCQICKRLIKRHEVAPHPLSPSIDHVIPQSSFVRHDRSAHDPANLRAAHFICNALRGAGGGGEQLALFG